MSALAGAVGGSAGISAAGNLISAVGSLLPSTSTTKGRTLSHQTASSDTEATELGLSGSSTNQSSESSGVSSTQNQTNSVANLLKNTLGSVTENSKSSSTVTGKASEIFSGQENLTKTQTLLTDPAVMRIINMTLSGQNGIAGLQQIASGERNAGVFDSSTNQLMTDNLLATVGGEVARLAAPTIKQESLGSTATSQTSSVQTITDAVSSAISKMSENQKSSESSKGNSSTSSAESSFTQQDVLNFMASLANQNTNQVADSDVSTSSKTKTKKCFITTLVVETLGLADNCEELGVLRGFRDGWLMENHPNAKEEYYSTAPAMVYQLRKLESGKLLELSKSLHTRYILPAVNAIKNGDEELAYILYTDMVQVVKNILARS